MIYVENPKAMNPLSENWNVAAETALVERLEKVFGEDNIKVV